MNDFFACDYLPNNQDRCHNDQQHPVDETSRYTCNHDDYQHDNDHRNDYSYTTKQDYVTNVDLVMTEKL